MNNFVLFTRSAGRVEFNLYFSFSSRWNRFFIVFGDGASATAFRVGDDQILRTRVFEFERVCNNFSFLHLTEIEIRIFYLDFGKSVRTLNRIRMLSGD